jgi:hypothetical protein
MAQEEDRRLEEGEAAAASRKLEWMQCAEVRINASSLRIVAKSMLQMLDDRLTNRDKQTKFVRSCC